MHHICEHQVFSCRHRDMNTCTKQRKAAARWEMHLPAWRDGLLHPPQHTWVLQTGPSTSSLSAYPRKVPLVTTGRGLAKFWAGFHPTVREGCRAGCRSLCPPTRGARRHCLPPGAPQAAAPLCTPTLSGGGGGLEPGKERGNVTVPCPRRSN